MAGLFTQHPQSVGETYGQHFLAATSFSRHMLTAAACCLVHAVFPFLFEKAASRTIERLHHSMVTHRSKATLDSVDAMPASKPLRTSTN